VSARQRESIPLYIYIYMFVCTGGDDGNSTLRLLYIPWSAAFNRSPTLSSTAVTARALTAARPPSIVHPPCPIRPPSVCVRDAAWSTNNNRPPARSSFHFRPSVHVRRRSLYARRVRHLRPPPSYYNIRAPPLRQRQINLFEPLLSRIYV